MNVVTWLKAHRQVADGLLALVLVPTVLPGITVGADHSWSGSFLAVVIGLAMLAALPFRRTFPAASAAAIFSLGALQLLLSLVIVFPADLLVLVALYTVTAYGERWASTAALIASGVGILAFGVGYLRSGLSGRSLAETAVIMLTMAALAATAWVLGLLRRSRVDRSETLAERARRLEIERDQQAKLAVGAERTRIAREMHDIVAHSLSVIIAQADGGRYAAQSKPEAAGRALATISETGRAALADMRRILGVLRTDPDEAEPAELAPMPISQDLDALVDTVRDAGVPVSLIRLGTARTLPPGVGLAVYRICQEALTNVMKHGGPGAKVVVVLQWTQTSLRLQVLDDGRGAASESSDGVGQGLVGMRERAEMFGGSLASGPKPGGGFAISAEIPIPAGSAGSPATEGARL